MYLKLIGGIILIFASTMLGIAIASKYSNRPKDLRSIRTFLQMLETEIIYGATPLPTAFKNISMKAEKIWSKFFYISYKNLISGNFKTLNDAWTASLNEISADTSLAKMDIEMLKGFGKVLGSSDRLDQQKHFNLFYSQLLHHEEIAEEERRKNERMYRSLGFLLGLVVFIILI